MMIAVIGAVGIIGAGLLGLVGVWLSDRTQMKKMATDANARLVDNLQEERQQIKRDLELVKKQVSGLLLQGRYKDDYINELRSHIEQGKPPPPPSYPLGLLRIATEGL
jgi:UDP-N-acetyl-D-mannosaminuronate dehydrogenase